MNSTKDGVKAIDSAKNTYVKNTTAQAEFLKTDAIYTSSSTMDKITRLFYLFFNDFVVIFIISFFVIAILFILKADPDFLYPNDLRKFPFVSAEYKQDISTIKNEGGFCSGTVDYKDPPQQKEEDKTVINIFNDIMNGTKAYKFSVEFHHEWDFSEILPGGSSLRVHRTSPIAAVSRRSKVRYLILFRT